MDGNPIPTDHDSFAKRCWDDWKPLVTNVTNERDYRSNGTIGGAGGGSRSSTVAAPREEFSSPRSIMERATSSPILGSWFAAMSRIPMGKVKSVCRADAKRCSDQWIFCVSEAAMCNNNCSRVCYPSEFFPDVKGNLTKIVWAHAVNSQAELEKALMSEDVMMLEADVVMGKLNISGGNYTDIPIMAHPPATESDLSLEDFLIISNTNGSKGIKLDFKSNEAFNNSKPILAKLRPTLKYPVFLNADILSGPINATPVPLNAKEFLNGANDTIPECILSVGWTTRYGKEFNITEGRYSTEQIKAMIDTLTENHVTLPVTYPVRAGLAANDIDAIKTLLKSTTFTNATLTIWSSEGDSVDAAQLSKLIKEVGVDKVYVDVPKDLRSKLNLSAASAITPVMMMNLGASLALLALSRML